MDLIDALGTALCILRAAAINGMSLTNFSSTEVAGLNMKDATVA